MIGVIRRLPILLHTTDSILWAATLCFLNNGLKRGLLPQKVEGRTLRPLRTSSLTQEKKEVDAVQTRITENIEIVARKKTMNDSNLILGCLKNHFIFYNLSENELENIKEKMFFCEIEEGDFVFQTG